MLHLSTNFDILIMVIGGLIIFTILVGLFELVVDIWEKCTGKTLEGSLRDWDELDD